MALGITGTRPKQPKPAFGHVYRALGPGSVPKAPTQSNSRYLAAQNDLSVPSLWVRAQSPGLQPGLIVFSPDCSGQENNHEHHCV